ncbi:MAG: hypothetical protein KDA60_05815 [Planctomycetales bacterium]|nr:hypothetical protein [Planctomycetales bacterium]
MRTNKFALGLLLAGLMFPATVRSETSVIAGWGNQLYPSYLFATATISRDDFEEENVLGDPLGLIGVEIEAQEDEQSVTVKVECDEFLEPTEFTCELAEEGEVYEIRPTIRYRYARLSDCHQATPATLSIRVQVGDEAPEVHQRVVLFRSINDCPFVYVDGEDEIDTSYTYAAYVNEDHPFVDKLLREALDIGIVNEFMGYQGESPESVMRQVYALWDLMVSRGVKYSDITTTSTRSGIVGSQHIRLIEDTVNNSQANCVDGSVLFVSMLRKIGINAGLVLEPEHCFVYFTTGDGAENIYGLETTAMGYQVKTPKRVFKVLKNAIDEEDRYDESWPNFVYAVTVATKKLREADEREENDEGMELTIINVGAHRENGFLAIPCRTHEEFVGFNFVVNEDDEEDGEEDWDEDDEQEEDEWDDEDEEEDEEWSDDDEEDEEEDWDA